MILELADAAEHILTLRSERANSILKGYEEQQMWIGVVSGGFDPIHPGHLSYLKQAWYMCDLLVILVNGDWFLQKKKGKAFMPLADRCKIVESVARPPSIVVPFDIKGDSTVSQALEILDPNVFLKGGDRTGPENIPEWETCVENEIEVMTDVGDEKEWSSRDYLVEWGDWYQKTGGVSYHSEST